MGAGPGKGNIGVVGGLLGGVSGPQHRDLAAVARAYFHQLVGIGSKKIQVAPFVGRRRNPDVIISLGGQLPSGVGPLVLGWVIAIHQFGLVGRRFRHRIQAVIEPLGQGVRLKWQHLPMHHGGLSQVIGRKRVNRTAVVFPPAVVAAHGRDAVHFAVAYLVGVAAAGQGSAGEAKGGDQQPALGQVAAVLTDFGPVLNLKLVAGAPQPPAGHVRAGGPAGRWRIRVFIAHLVVAAKILLVKMYYLRLG